MKNPIHRGIVPAIVALAAAMHAPAADAANYRSHTISAPAVCEAANAADDALMRRQPLGIKNEGRRTIAINCSLFVDSATQQISVLNVETVAGGVRPVDEVACTLLIGTAASAMELPGDDLGAGMNIVWSGVPRTNPQDMVSLSCTVPRGASIRNIYFSERDYRGGL